MANVSFDQNTASDGLIEKTVRVSRHAKVVTGGRTFSFAAEVVVGDGNGRIGHARRSAAEVPEAMRKALEAARRDMVRIELNGKTLHHPIVARHGASKIFMKPASAGTGIIAGGAMRAVFEVLGIQDVLAKSIGSTNPSNVIRAVLSGLKGMASPEYVAEKRGKSVAEVVGVEQHGQ